MSKITSEDCKTALNDHWPSDGHKSPSDWKRVSKTGTAKTVIVRVFQHRNQKKYGIVCEVSDKITSVAFTDSLPAQPSGTAKSMGRVAKASTGSTTVGAVGEPGRPASNGRVSADEFLFAVCERDNRRTSFAICRRDFWHQHHRLSDDGFGDLLDGLLPPGTSVASECQYSNKMGRKQLYEFLLAQGFGDDERFTAYMDGYQPGE